MNLRRGEKHERQIELFVKKRLTKPSNQFIVKGFNFGDFYINESVISTGLYRWSWEDSVELAYQVQLVNRVRKEELLRDNLKLGEKLHDHGHEH